MKHRQTLPLKQNESFNCNHQNRVGVNTDDMTDTLHNIGLVYSDLGRTQEALEKFEASLQMKYAVHPQGEKAQTSEITVLKQAISLLQPKVDQWLKLQARVAKKRGGKTVSETKTADEEAKDQSKADAAMADLLGDLNLQEQTRKAAKKAHNRGGNNTIGEKPNNKKGKKKKK